MWWRRVSADSAILFYNAFVLLSSIYHLININYSFYQHAFNLPKNPLIPDMKGFCSILLVDDTLCSSRGWQGLIAYGCHSLVLVVDANSAQTLQVLERHKASVVKVRCTWFKVYYLVLVQMLSF